MNHEENVQSIDITFNINEVVRGIVVQMRGEIKQIMVLFGQNAMFGKVLVPMIIRMEIIPKVVVSLQIAQHGAPKLLLVLHSLHKVLVLLKQDVNGNNSFNLF
jgi:hypothetical protein